MLQFKKYKCSQINNMRPSTLTGTHITTMSTRTMTTVRLQVGDKNMNLRALENI